MSLSVVLFAVALLVGMALFSPDNDTKQGPQADPSSSAGQASTLSSSPGTDPSSSPSQTAPQETPQPADDAGPGKPDKHDGKPKH